MNALDLLNWAREHWLFSIIAVVLLFNLIEHLATLVWGKR